MYESYVVFSIIGAGLVGLIGWMIGVRMWSTEREERSSKRLPRVIRNHESTHDTIEARLDRLEEITHFELEAGTPSSFRFDGSVTHSMKYVKITAVQLVEKLIDHLGIKLDVEYARDTQLIMTKEKKRGPKT